MMVQRIIRPRFLLLELPLPKTTPRDQDLYFWVTDLVHSMYVDRNRHSWSSFIDPNTRATILPFLDSDLLSLVATSQKHTTFFQNLPDEGEISKDRQIAIAEILLEEMELYDEAI